MTQPDPIQIAALENDARPQITLEILSNALAWLAGAVDEDPAAVARDLRRDTALARTLRKAFVETKTTKRSPRGRPRKDHERALDRLVVDALQGRGSTFEKAIEEAVKIRAAQGRRGNGGAPLTEDGLKTSVARQSRTSKLGRLFIPDQVLEPVSKVTAKI